MIAVLNQEPRASFTSADIATFLNIAPGTDSTLLATINDAKGASGGAILFTIVNAVFENADASQAHAQFGTVTGTWQMYSSDGQTSPISFSRA